MLQDEQLWSGLRVLALRGGLIAEITAFVNPEAVLRFDLPASIPA